MRMFHVKHEAWATDLRNLGLSVLPGQLDALSAYTALLKERAIPRGIISAADADRLWERHVLDGARGAAEISGEGLAVADLGSGAGIPGIPIAILLPGCLCVLVEPRRGRVAFLESVVDDLRLANVEVVLGRAEELPKGAFDVCVARALSSPTGTWAAAEPLLRVGGFAVYWAGQGFAEQDLDAMAISWRVSTRTDLAESGPLVIMGRQ